MANPQKDRGDRAEREVQGLLRDHLGIPARRKLGAGRKDDIGDIDAGDMTIQVADWKDIGRALREKPRECEQQQGRAGTSHGYTFIRLRGGEWRVVQTFDQWAASYRESW